MNNFDNVIETYRKKLYTLLTLYNTNRNIDPMAVLDNVNKVCQEDDKVIYVNHSNVSYYFNIYYDNGNYRLYLQNDYSGLISMVLINNGESKNINMYDIEYYCSTSNDDYYNTLKYYVDKILEV